MNRADSWAYVSGVCAAREAAFFNARFFAELAALSPVELSNRLSRSFFGPVEPLASFDPIARQRRRREFDEIESLCPDRLPVTLLRLRFAGDSIRKALDEVPDRVAPEELGAIMVRLSLRASDFAALFAAQFCGPFEGRGVSARQAASLLVDSAELLLTLRIAQNSGDLFLVDWARAAVRVGSAKVASRAVAAGVPRQTLDELFFRQELLTVEAQEFLAVYVEAAAEWLYPDGATAGGEEAYLLSVCEGFKAEPFSAARVLGYLAGFLDQERKLRLAVYTSLGRISREVAA